MDKEAIVAKLYPLVSKEIFSKEEVELARRFLVRGYLQGIGEMIEWTNYSKPVFGHVLDLGDCATLVAHIPIKDYDNIWGKREE